MHTILSSRSRFPAFLFTMALASAALAQGVTGSALFGTVTDQDKSPVGDVVIQLKNEATGLSFTALTDAKGTYFFDNLPSGGPYTLTGLSDRYYGYTRKDMMFMLGDRVRIDIQLRKFETMTEEVTIVGRRADKLEDNARTGPSTAVQADRMDLLPLQGRNFTDLVATAPQVSGNSMAGQNNRFNNIQIDGAAYNDLFGLASSGTPGGQANAKPLSIEAIDTFKVEVSPFDVRYGNFAGGLVNAVTKSGTNDYHGSVFTYWQNKLLAGYQKDPAFLGYNILQYGASAGGPIIKDKLHFFAAVDLQERSSSFGNSAQLTGDDKWDLDHAGFTNATAERFRSILRDTYHTPDPGTAMGAQLGNPDRNVFAKLSTSMIPNSYLELSYNFVNAQQDTLIRSPTSPTLTGRMRDGYEMSNSGYAQATYNNTGRVKMVSTFLDGKLSNEFLGGFSIIRDARDPGMDIPLILVKVGRLGNADSWLAAGDERFSQLNQLDQDIYQVQDSATYKLGDHAFTVGTSNEFLRIRNAYFQAKTGVWAFNSLDDFEAGIPAAYQRRFAVPNSGQEGGTARFNVAQWGFYAQDSWQFAKGLTLNPGVRMDVPFLSKANINQRLVANAAFPIDTGKVPTGNFLWSPRLGFNWDVYGTSDTIVRGGLGVFSGRPPYVWVANAYSINGLSQVELTCSGATGVPAFTVDPNNQPYDCVGGNAQPAVPTNQGEIDYFDPKTQYPQNFRTALGADQRLPGGIVTSLDVLWTQDINGWYTNDENLIRQGANSGEGRAVYGTFTPSTTRFTATPKRIDNTNLRQAVKVYNLNGGSVFNATMQAQKSFQQWVDVNVAYTYTNSQDRISLTSSQALSNFQYAPVDGTLADRNVRPSAFDRTHRITLTATANIPYGFAASLVYVGQSGLPYTWVVNGDVNADGINGNDLAFIPADPSQITLAPGSDYAALSKFIDSQECLRNARGGFVQRGACRNPWQNFLDMRLAWTSKPFYLDHKVEVQLDIFNVLNLLNSKWGLYQSDSQFETHAAQFLKAVGYDAANSRPIYSFAEPAAVRSTVYSPTLSRWRIQGGVKYTF